MDKENEIHQSFEINKACDFSIGKRSFIGNNVRVFGDGKLKIGNHVKIHNNVTLCIKGEAYIEDCSWIGQDAFIDATGSLKINRFSVLGIGSTICTHVRGGDTLFGCRYEGDFKAVLGEDSWLMTKSSIGPYTLGAKSIALMGAVITKNFGDNKIIGGCPARDLTPKLGAPFLKKSNIEIHKGFSRLIETYKKNNQINSNVEFGDDLSNWSGIGSFYNLKRRECHTYISEEEIELNKWLFGFRAKFSMVYHGSSSK